MRFSLLTFPSPYNFHHHIVVVGPFRLRFQVVDFEFVVSLVHLFSRIYLSSYHTPPPKSECNGLFPNRSNINFQIFIPKYFGIRYNALKGDRSEEHTSELQSRENLVCRLLLEKKKKKNKEQ